MCKYIPNDKIQCSVISLLTSDNDGIGSIFSGFLSFEFGSRGIWRRVVAK